MTFEIAHAQDFPMELALVPKKVKGAYRSIVTGVLVTEPDRPAPPRVKRLERVALIGPPVMRV